MRYQTTFPFFFLWLIAQALSEAGAQDRQINTSIDASGLFDAQISNMEAIEAYDLLYRNERSILEDGQSAFSLTETVRILDSPRSDFALMVRLVEVDGATIIAESEYRNDVSQISSWNRIPSLTVHLYHSGRSMNWRVGMSRQEYVAKTHEEFRRLGHAIDLRFTGISSFPRMTSVSKSHAEKVFLKLRTAVTGAKIQQDAAGEKVTVAREIPLNVEFFGKQKLATAFDIRSNLILEHRQHLMMRSPRYRPTLVEAIEWGNVNGIFVPTRVSGEKMTSKWNDEEIDSEIYEFDLKWVSVNESVEAESVPFYRHPTYENLLKLV